MTLADRLGRLLFVVPYVAHRDGVPLKELAAKLGVKPSRVERDLALLCMVGRPPLTPDHLIDLYVEDEVVYVDLDQRLSRPPRLTHEEARALVLGAKLVGDQGGLGKELEEVLEHIALRLDPAEQALVRSLSRRIAVAEESQQSCGPLAQMRSALENHQELEMEYYSASSDRLKTYRVQPLARVTHSGVEYFVALDTGAEGQEKLFRLDRMGSAQKLEAHFTPPKDLGLERFRTDRLYYGKDGLVAEVWFSAKVAREVSERFAGNEVEWQDDGSVRVRLSSSSPTWLCRWVLPFGTEAQVLGPTEQRRMLGELCAEAARAYSA